MKRGKTIEKKNERHEKRREKVNEHKGNGAPKQREKNLFSDELEFFSQNKKKEN